MPIRVPIKPRILKETAPFFIVVGIQGDLAVPRPLFPLIIAGGFKLWGKSVHSAVLVVRIVFALEIILIYLIGRVFFGATAGLLSVGLVISSHGIRCYCRSG
jgi:asparagine N-glycosylation enzyme membrane subunit Stt3